MTTTLSSTTLEVATQCAASLARVATGAYDISATRFGRVSIQGHAVEMPDDLAELLGVTFTHTHLDGNGSVYAHYEGKGRGVYSDIDVRLTTVSPALPADCESAEAQ